MLLTYTLCEGDNGDWVVEDETGEQPTIFRGVDAKLRAVEYAEWMNSWQNMIS